MPSFRKEVKEGMNELLDVHNGIEAHDAWKLLNNILDANDGMDALFDVSDAIHDRTIRWE